MSWELSTNNNYTYFTNTVDGDLSIKYPGKDLFYRESANAIDIVFKFDRSTMVIIQKSDITSPVFADNDALIDWLDDNTGGDNQLNYTDGALDVILQDSTSDLIIVPFSLPVSDHLFAVQGVRGSYDIVIDTPATITDGDLITIFNPDLDKVMFTHAAATTGTTITINHQLDDDYPVGTFLSVGRSNMNVNGSVTPQVFGVRNPTIGSDVPFEFDIVRMTFEMLTTSKPDLSQFGNISGGLDRGVLCRKVDGIWTNLFHFDTNGKLKTLTGTDLDIETATGNQQDGLTARLTFGGQSKMGSVVRVGQDEDAQIIIQDDLTSLISFRIFAQGSRVRN